MPFSNQKLEGFENKIAALIARELGTTVSYIWWGQRRGFIRNTMNATLQEGRCDLVIGVPEGYDLVSTTPPYYRSTYVFVYPKGKGIAVKSLDDPALKTLKIGVHLLGDDYTTRRRCTSCPSAASLTTSSASARFIRRRIRRARSSTRWRAAGSISPSCGDRSPDTLPPRQRVPLELVPVPSGKGDLPFAFNISMGVKKGDEALKARVDKVRRARSAEIAGILKELWRASCRRRAESFEMTHQLRLMGGGGLLFLAVASVSSRTAAQLEARHKPPRSRHRTPTRASMTAGSGGMCTVTAVTAPMPSARPTRRI